MCEIKKLEWPNENIALELSLLDSICFNKEDTMDKDEWHELLQKDDNIRVYGAIIDNDLVGIAVLRCTVNNTYYLYSNAVEPSYRNKGIGGKLVRARIKYAHKQHPHCIIFAHTKINNSASMALLANESFEVVSYIPDYYDDFEDALLWKLELWPSTE